MNFPGIANISMHDDANCIFTAQESFHFPRKSMKVAIAGAVEGALNNQAKAQAGTPFR